MRIDYRRWKVPFGLVLMVFGTVAQAANSGDAVASAITAERLSLLPITVFYDSHAISAHAKPGSLIASEDGSDYQLPKGAKATRFAYVTSAPDGRPRSATAVVILPSDAPPSGGWPVIAWAHGTTGVDRPCAPTRMKNLEYGWDELYNLLGLGYAVVATDYQGLGSDGPHPWIDKITNADDVRYALQAARLVSPQLGSKWVVMGHSQGGLSAIGVAEQELQTHDAGYLGAVVVAFGDAEPTFVRLSQQADSPDAQPYYDAFMAYLAQAIKAINPAFEPREILTQEARDRSQSAAGHCTEVYAAAMQGLSQRPALHDWNRNKHVQRFFDRIRPTGNVAGPLLVAASSDDEAVAIDSVDSFVRTLCDHRAQVDYVRYSGVGLDHIGVLHSTLGLRVRWIRDRFSGQAAPGSCKSLGLRSP